MDIIGRFLLDFVLLSTLVYLLHIFFFMKKRNDYKNLKKNDEVKLFIARYNLDMRKTNYKTVLRVVCLCNSIIMGFTSALVLNIKGYFWKISISFVVIFILLYSLFELFGRLLKRKEESKNV